MDANFNRLDYSERPELQKGTVDFVVSESSDYWASNPPPHITLTSFIDLPQSDVARIPQTIRYIFALDVSHTSVLSGFLTSACVALRTLFYGRFSEDGSENVQESLPPGSSIALVTFDDAVHLYELSVCTVFQLCLPRIDTSLQPNQTTPRQLVIPDVDEPFLPIPHSALFVDPHQSRFAHSF